MKKTMWASVSVAVVFLQACTVVYNEPAEAPTSAPPPPHQAQPQLEEDGQDDDWRPSNLAEAIQACRTVAAANDIPIGCEFDYIEGLPMMALGFPDVATADEYWDSVTTYVGGPFCDSANNANRQAYLYWIVVSQKVGNFFACETGEASGWFDLDGSDRF